MLVRRLESTATKPLTVLSPGKTIACLFWPTALTIWSAASTNSEPFTGLGRGPEASGGPTPRVGISSPTTRPSSSTTRRLAEKAELNALGAGEFVLVRVASHLSLCCGDRPSSCAGRQNAGRPNDGKSWRSPRPCCRADDQHIAAHAQVPRRGLAGLDEFQARGQWPLRSPMPRGVVEPNPTASTTASNFRRSSSRVHVFAELPPGLDQ